MVRQKKIGSPAAGGGRVICQYCGYEFPDECGKYGCPNCNGEGLENIFLPYLYRVKRLRSGIKNVGNTIKIGVKRFFTYDKTSTYKPKHCENKGLRRFEQNPFVIISIWIGQAPSMFI